MSVIRSILGIIAGFLIASIVIFVLTMVNGYLHPIPPGASVQTAEDVKKVFMLLPVTAFIGLLLTYFFGLFFGGFAAAKIAGRGEIVHGFIISVLFALIGISNFAVFPAPVWVIVSSFIIYFVAGFFGASFAASLRKAKEPQA